MIDWQDRPPGSNHQDRIVQTEQTYTPLRDDDDVDTFTATKRGFFGRCPHCGEGRMFRAFLKVADNCPVCGEELHHHRADDFPAYLVIVIVGHAVVPLILAMETHVAPAYWVHIALWPAMVLGLSLGLLQPVKGAIVGLQWAMDMHGFEEAKLKRALQRGAGPLDQATLAPQPFRKTPAS
jgi:uncharacterized protein (DUF983 family)